MQHVETLKMAFNQGISLVDTAPNFNNGQAELAVGKALREIHTKPIVVSKVGYSLTLKKGTFKLANGSFYSLSPEFIAQEITRSSKTLGVDAIDIYLLNNPESLLKSHVFGSKSEVYDYIATALNFLESEVLKGRIKSYGIATFIVLKFIHKA